MEYYYEKYRISGDKVTHMKLQTLSISENETLSMLKRYRFDVESTQKMVDEAQRITEDLKIKQEQKEYEEMNYEAIYRRLNNYSMFKLFKILLRSIKAEFLHEK